MLSASNLLSRGRAYPPPLDRADVSFWYCGRTAIWEGVRALGLQPGERVLVPAYSCGSETDALLKAGLHVEYYRVRPDLTPDLDHVDALCATPARALYLIHYFGFSQPMDALRAFAAERGLLLLEDTAPGLYSSDERGRPLGTLGDMAIFSMVKSVPLPDGGALLLNRPHSPGADVPPPRRPDRLSVAGKVKHLLVQTAAHRYPRATASFSGAVLEPLVSSLKARRGMPPTPAALDLDPESRDMQMIVLKPERVAWRASALARRLFHRMPHDEIRARRRRNFSALAGRLEAGPGWKALHTRLPSGCCPWFYPLLVEEPVAFQRHLAANGIACKRTWSYFHSMMPREAFPFESRLKMNVISLPIHQDLDDEDTAYLADVVLRRKP